MPELPEVEVFRKSIEPFIINQTISSVIIKTKKLGNKNPNNIKHKILGKSVQSVERHGKYILIYLTFGNLIIHLGMSGQLRLFAQNDPLNKHDHVVIIFSSGISLRINDPRKFGSIVWVSGNPLQIKPLNNLGIDPISREFSGEYLYNKSRKRSITIKQFIMNTKVIAGVGNIYANEALFAAGIHPLRKANAISRKRYNHLAIVLTVSWQIHVVIAIMAIIGMMIVESFKVNVKQPFYNEKVQAARYMLQGIEIIKQHRLRNIGPINKVIDPMRTGLIGVLSTPITSTTVDIDSKLTSINPNWAAAIVSMLKEAKVKKGSTVAVSLTGSFPAMNLAVMSAAKALKLRLIIITSVSASTWGANIPGLTWLDMENELYVKKFSQYRSVAASLGGVQDSALGMSEEGKKILRDTIMKYNITPLEFGDMKTRINARMELYHDQARDTQIAAYINVGGGTVAIGSFIGKRRYRAGLNLKPSQRAMRVDSVMSRFARADVPIVNINYLKTLAQKFSFPIAPKKIPTIGQGEIYNRLEYNKALVALVLVSLIVFLFLFMKMGIGYRIFIPQKKSVKARPPEHMV